MAEGVSRNAGAAGFMSAYQVIRRWLLYLDERVLVPVFGSSRRLASLYYALISTKFGREHRAVLAGRRAYYRSVSSPQDSSFMLRRNIHRLEKGLIMSPRKPIFAADYIEETVSQFQVLKASGGDEAELQWASDVLSDYFAAVERDATISRAFESFAAALQSSTDYKAHAPYSSDDRELNALSYEDFYALCRRRRSVRWYEQKAVPRSVIDKAVAAAAQAPSACNRQPFRFSVFDNSDEAAQVGAITHGTAGFAQNFPCLIVVVGDLSAYPFERDRHLIYVDAALASMQLMLAFETLGLSSCPINWPDIEVMEREMADRLRLTSYERPIMLISVGYPASEGLIPFSQKRPVDSLIRWESE